MITTNFHLQVSMAKGREEKLIVYRLLAMDENAR
jgi:hypothetical protein